MDGQHFTSPQGTTVNLITQRGGSGKNFCTVLLDDQGSFPSVSTIPATGAVTGNFTPESPLSAFNGENPNGNWTLNVADGFNLDTGTVNRFSLLIAPKVCNSACIASKEADVATRFSGDGVYQAADPSLIEEFLIFAKTPNLSFNEFQRADCAPYSSKGDGRLTINDVNLAEQYLISAVAPQSADGPTQPVPPPAAQKQNSLNLKGKADSNVEKAALLPRVIKAVDVSTSAGATVVVPILIDAQGDETGYSFTLDYDPSILTNTAILDGGVGGTRAFVIGDAPNNGVAKGKTTFSLQNFTGGPNSNAVPRGNSQVLVRVQFLVNAGAAAGTTQLTFSGSPTANSVTNVNSQPLDANFVAGTITITGTTAAGAVVSGRVQNGTGRGVTNAQVIMTNSLGERRTARTNGFGYFRFGEVASGESYTMTVKSKQYRFAAQVVNVTQDLDNVNFTALR